MKLTVRDAGESNFGKYSCVAKNPRGQTDGSITLYARAPPTTIPPPTTPTTTTLLTYKVHYPENKLHREEGYGASPNDINEDQFNKKRRQDRRRNKDRHHRRTTETAWYDLDPVPQYSGSSQLQSSPYEVLVQLALGIFCIHISSKSVTSAFLVFSSIFISSLTPSSRMEN